MSKITKFVVAGGVVAVFNVALLYFFVSTLHVHYLLASAISFIFALNLNFLLQKYWAFSDSLGGQTMNQFLLFFILVFLNFFLNLLLMFLFVDKFSIQYLLAQIFVTVILATLNFGVYQRFIFKKN